MEKAASIFLAIVCNYGPLSCCSLVAPRLSSTENSTWRGGNERDCSLTPEMSAHDDPHWHELNKEQLSRLKHRRACLCISEQLTYSNNMRHPARTLNPNETYNHWCPVFPNRTPGRQPSISHGCKVVGSTFFQNSRDDSELLIKTEFDGAYADFGVCVKFAIIILGTTFSCLFYLPSCSSQVWARLGVDVAPPSPSQADRWYTCERRLLHLACRSLCIPSFRRSDLSTDKYHGNSRAWLPAPLWRRTAPAEL